MRRGQARFVTTARNRLLPVSTVGAKIATASAHAPRLLSDVYPPFVRRVDEAPHGRVQTQAVLARLVQLEQYCRV